jgi:hypothetical protein
VRLNIEEAKNQIPGKPARLDPPGQKESSPVIPISPHYSLQEEERRETDQSIGVDGGDGNGGGRGGHVYVHYVCADATTNYEKQRELFLFASGWYRVPALGGVVLIVMAELMMVMEVTVYVQLCLCRCNNQLYEKQRQ